MTRSSLIKEIKELLDNNLSEWVDIRELVLKHTEGMDITQAASVRRTIFVILEEMKDRGDITYDRSMASMALMTRMQGQFPSDSVRVRTTMKYDDEYEQKNKIQTIPNQTNIHNFGNINNSSVGNIQSSSNDFINPLINIDNTNNEQIKKSTSSLEKLYWVGGIILAIIGILVYLKIYPFNK